MSIFSFFSFIPLIMNNNTIKAEYEMTDIGEIVGVDSEGYGKVSKCVMLDPKLSPSSKGLFAYYATYTGGGRQFAFPSRGKILRDLGIGAASMYKHRKGLEERGYVTVKEVFNEIHMQQNNHYLINMNPENVLDELSENHYKRQNLKGYGNMPRMVALDKELDIKSIGLYGYISALSGADGYCMFSFDYQLKTFGLKTEPFQNHIKKLVDRGYITKYQLHVGGSIRGTVYELTDHRLDSDEIEDAKKIKVRTLGEDDFSEMFRFYSFEKKRKSQVSGFRTPLKHAVDETFAQVSGSGTPRKTKVLQVTGFETPDTETADFETSDFRTSINNNRNINNINNNNIITPSLPDKNEGKELFCTMVRSYQEAAKVIKETMGLKDRTVEWPYVDFSIETLARMLMGDDPFIVKGCTVTSDDVLEKLNSRLNYPYFSKMKLVEMICLFAGKMEEVDCEESTIKNKQAYMKALIYDALLSMTLTLDGISDLSIRSLYEKRVKLISNLS